MSWFGSECIWIYHAHLGINATQYSSNPNITSIPSNDEIRQTALCNKWTSISHCVLLWSHRHIYCMDQCAGNITSAIQFSASLYWHIVRLAILACDWYEGYDELRADWCTIVQVAWYIRKTRPHIVLLYTECTGVYGMKFTALCAWNLRHYVHAICACICWCIQCVFTVIGVTEGLWSALKYFKMLLSNKINQNA